MRLALLAGCLVACIKPPLQAPPMPTGEDVAEQWCTLILGCSNLVPADERWPLRFSECAEKKLGTVCAGDPSCSAVPGVQECIDAVAVMACDAAALPAVCLGVL